MKKEDKLLGYYKYLSVKLALKMYDTFAHELITALRNTSDIMGRMKWTSNCVQKISYYSGKEDAFGEIADRVMKEYGLAKMGLECLNEVDSEDFYDTYEKNRQLIEYVIDSIKRKKNEDVDRVFPEDRYRGSQFGREIIRKKGRIADMLEAYANEAFGIGVIAERKFKEFLPNEHHMTPKKLMAEIERAKSGIEFDPEDFAVDLSDSVIDPQTKEMIYFPGNLRYVYNESPHYEKVEKLKNKIYGEDYEGDYVPFNDEDREHIFNEIKKAYSKKDKKDKNDNN